MDTGAHRKLAEEVLAAARAAKLKIATAESCTGGLVAAALTASAGSSDVFDRGFFDLFVSHLRRVLCREHNGVDCDGLAIDILQRHL